MIPAIMAVYKMPLAGVLELTIDQFHNLHRMACELAKARAI